jgi:hypothetical protein
MIEYIKQDFPVGGMLPTIIGNFGREDFGKMFKALGFTRGVEIGTWQGEFAAALCASNPDLHLICIDPWKPYKEFHEPITPIMFTTSKAIATARLLHANCEIICEFSNIAVLSVPDNSLDFVYIDGNHSFFSVVEDLTLWSPKVKVGGVISGHDYDLFYDQPQIQVKYAVQGFTRAHRIDPWFVTEKPDIKSHATSFLWEKT